MKHILIICLCALLLTACSTREKDPTVEAENTATPSTMETQMEEIETTPATESFVPESTEAEVILTVYFPDANLEGFETVGVTLDAVTESAIVEQLVIVDVLSEGIAVNSLEKTASADTPEEIHLNVDFNSDFRDLILSQGSSGERAIIGSVVNTFLTAYAAQTISITVDGEILESGHVVYDFPLEFFK